MLKIFFSVNHSGCAWWRSRQPAEMIKKLGLAQVEIFSQYDTARNDVGRMLAECDLIVAQSPCGVTSVALTREYQEMGKVVIIDYDDLVYSCSPFNPAYRTLGIRNVNVKDVDGNDHTLWKDGEKGFSIKDNYGRYRSQEDLFKLADGVTVTTEYLKDRFIEENPILKDKITVIPNSINFNLFYPFPKRKNDRIRIGWTASSSHLNEVWMVRDIFRKLFEKYGNKIVFVQMGDIQELNGVFTPEQFEYHRFIDITVYPLKFASLNLDIGICPLVDDEFNRCKSALKWSEYASMKVPAVCSDLPSYNCVEDGKTGFLAKDVDEFVDKISRLVDDEVLRREIAENAYQKNFADFNLEKNVVNMVKFYEDTYNRVGEYR
jgi:glycosyltransferase involved in cell wall biosynthesis